MEQLLIKYNSDKHLVPKYLKKEEIWDLSWQLRQVAKLEEPKINPKLLASNIKELLVNFQPITLSWELNDVFDGNRSGIYGTCFPDEQNSQRIFISLNKASHRTEGQTLTTLAHELGHAIFDMPAIAAGHRPISAFNRTKRSGAPASREEWRANEFMGSFLVPKQPLQRLFIEISNLYDMPVNREMGGILDTDLLDNDMLGLIVDELAFKFGVSQTVIEIRLQQYGLVRRSPKVLAVEKWKASRRSART